MKVIYRPEIAIVTRVAKPKVFYVPGIPGPPGVGGGGAAKYTWTQAIAASTWTITHTLTDFSHVTFLDAAGRMFLGNWQRISNTQISAGPFSPAQSGTAHIS